MSLTNLQENLLDSLGSSYLNGLDPLTVIEIRSKHSSFPYDDHFVGLNKLTPPVNCPAWACVILPCINHVPSMRMFRLIEPDDAEVLRGGKWICYDAASVVPGDIMRLTEGDTVPADCTVLSLGMDHLDTSSTGELQRHGNRSLNSYIRSDTNSKDDLIVDLRLVTGEVNPRTIGTSDIRGGTDLKSLRLFCGGSVISGAGIAVATAIGSQTLVASLIQDGRFPPAAVDSRKLDDGARGRVDDPRDNESLLQVTERNTVM